MKVFNFYAGPAILPKEVVTGVKKALDSFGPSGLSLSELSHRSKEIGAMINETTDLIKKNLKVPKNYSVFFVQGGATNQFSMIPMNLSQKKDDKIGYIETGAWSTKAIKDAQILHELGYGKPIIVETSKPQKYKLLPKIKSVPQDLKYLHICDNETIHGIEYFVYPDTDKVPILLDCSSSIFSKPIDWENKNIGMIYAGAQKNSGMAGSTILILRNDLVNKEAKLPAYLKYANHVTKDSAYNTPPVVAIYSVNLMMKWLENKGGVEGIEKINIKKSNILYDCIDNSNGFYTCPVVKENRSRMNVVFNLKTKELEAKILEEATKNGLVGLKGHRSLGGCRASIYNAMPVEGVQALVDFMKDFQKKNEKN